MYEFMAKYALRTHKRKVESFPNETFFLRPVAPLAHHRSLYNLLCSIILRNRLQSHGSFAVRQSSRLAVLLNPQNKDHMHVLHVNLQRALCGMPLFYRQAYNIRTPIDCEDMAQRLRRRQNTDQCEDEDIVPVLLGGRPFPCSQCDEEYPLPMLLPCRHLICAQCCTNLHEAGQSLFPSLPDAQVATVDPWLVKTKVRCPLPRCAEQFSLYDLHFINLGWELFVPMEPSKKPPRASTGRTRKARSTHPTISSALRPTSRSTWASYSSGCWRAGYDSPAAFLAEARIVFENAMKYNPAESLSAWIHHAAMAALKVLVKSVADIQAHTV